MLTTKTLAGAIRLATEDSNMINEKTGFVQFTRNVLWAGESFQIGDIKELSERECQQVEIMKKGIILTEDEVSKIEAEQELEDEIALEQAKKDAE